MHTNNLSYASFLKCLVFFILLTGCSPSVPDDLATGKTTIVDDFTDLSSLATYTTNNPKALPDVSFVNGRYQALVRHNKKDITLHFNQSQGRLDAHLVTFPFRAIVRNVGIGTVDNSQKPPAAADNPVLFSGIQIHHSDLNSINSSHLVVGHRWKTHFTVEGKNTVDGRSSVSDEGALAVPHTRADLLIVGNEDRTLTAFWQLPNTNISSQPDQWQPYGKNGKLPGQAPQYGDKVYVGLITYAQMEAGLPFVGTADQLWINY